MPRFKLTALHNIDRANGFHISKGQEIIINIPMVGITPNNLFNNSRCKELLIKQFKTNGIDMPYSDVGIFSRGAWKLEIEQG